MKNMMQVLLSLPLLRNISCEVLLEHLAGNVVFKRKRDQLAPVPLAKSTPYEGVIRIQRLLGAGMKRDGVQYKEVSTITRAMMLGGVYTSEHGWVEDRNGNIFRVGGGIAQAIHSFLGCGEHLNLERDGGELMKFLGSFKLTPGDFPTNGIQKALRAFSLGLRQKAWSPILRVKITKRAEYLGDEPPHAKNIVVKQFFELLPVKFSRAEFLGLRAVYQLRNKFHGGIKPHQLKWRSRDLEIACRVSTDALLAFIATARYWESADKKGDIHIALDVVEGSLLSRRPRAAIYKRLLERSDLFLGYRSSDCGGFSDIIEFVGLGLDRYMGSNGMGRECQGVIKKMTFSEKKIISAHFAKFNREMSGHKGPYMNNSMRVGIRRAVNIVCFIDAGFDESMIDALYNSDADRSFPKLEARKYTKDFIKELNNFWKKFKDAPGGIGEEMRWLDILYCEIMIENGYWGMPEDRKAQWGRCLALIEGAMGLDEHGRGNRVARLCNHLKLISGVEDIGARSLEEHIDLSNGRQGKEAIFRDFYERSVGNRFFNQNQSCLTQRVMDLASILARGPKDALASMMSLPQGHHARVDMVATAAYCGLDSERYSFVGIIKEMNEVLAMEECLKKSTHWTKEGYDIEHFFGERALAYFRIFKTISPWEEYASRGIEEDRMRGFKRGQFEKRILPFVQEACKTGYEVSSSIMALARASLTLGIERLAAWLGVYKKMAKFGKISSHQNFVHEAIQMAANATPDGIDFCLKRINPSMGVDEKQVRYVAESSSPWLPYLLEKKVSLKSAFRYLMLADYNEAGIHGKIATACASAATSVEYAIAYQEWYDAHAGKARGRKSTIPSFRSKEQNGISIEILGLDDPNGPILGYYTGCCQSVNVPGFDHAGYRSAEHGFLSNNGRFIVLRDASEEIVIQSHVWRHGEIIVFDSMEGKTDRYHDEATVLYKYAAQEILRMDKTVKRVHGGNGFDGEITTPVHSNESMYTGDSYNMQVIIAKR